MSKSKMPRLVLGALGIIVAIGCGSSTVSDGPSATASDGPSATAPEVSGDPVEPVPLPTAADRARLTETLRALTAPEMRGRLTGTPTGELAEAYVTSRLAEAGFQVQAQSVPMSVYEPAAPIALEIVPDSGPKTSFAYIDDFREVGFSGSGSATGTLTFVGIGAPADYASLDVRGKIVAVMTGTSSSPERIDERIDAAATHGAAGVVFVLGPVWEPLEDGQPSATQVSAERPDGLVNTSRLRPDLPVVFVHWSATKRLLGRTAASLAASPTPFELSTRVHLEVHGTSYPTSSCKNVLGVLPGTDPAVGSETIILGAHYDHVGPGADGRIFPGAGDNGSGAAVVLETAAAFGKLGRAPRRTVLFALWCGEEQGLIGSFAYVKAPLIPLARTRLVLNVDYLGESDGPYILSEGDSSAFDVLGSAKIQRLDWPFQCGSDECPFWLKSKIPFIHFIAMGDHYHLPSDTFENLNLTLIGRVADVIAQGLGRIAY